jgi:hypothetical protein
MNISGAQQVVLKKRLSPVISGQKKLCSPKSSYSFLIVGLLIVLVICLKGIVR